MAWFSWLGTDSTDTQLPNIFPLDLEQEEFINQDCTQTYRKILTDTMERVSGVPEKVDRFLWDNCVQSDSNFGLVSLLADAMCRKRDLYLIYKGTTDTLRKATPEEERKIREDYAKQAQSSTGTFISFKNYERTDMLRIYSAFEYCLIASMNKSLNLSTAIQLKIHSLRGSVSLNDSQIAVNQAKTIASALSRGKDILCDKEDEIMTPIVDTSPIEKTMDLLDAKKAFVLGMPLSYINGEQTTGIGSTGEADTKAVERGLKQYYVSILRPVLQSVFKLSTQFKTQDFRQLGSAMELLKTFDLVSNDFLSVESKREYVARIMELDLKKEEKLIEKGLADADNVSAVEDSEESRPEEGRRAPNLQ